ncbi:predicted protein [Streptomyces sp. SPB78]|nr:predicted protein [Streptomyces sp. SPB78]
MCGRCAAGARPVRGLGAWVEVPPPHRGLTLEVRPRAGQGAPDGASGSKVTPGPRSGFRGHSGLHQVDNTRDPPARRLSPGRRCPVPASRPSYRGNTRRGTAAIRPSPSRPSSPRSPLLALQPIAMRGWAAGLIQVMIRSIVGRGTETQPAVAPAPLMWRKMPAPRPGVAGRRL